MKQLLLLMIIALHFNAIAQEVIEINGDVTNENFFLEFGIYTIGDPIDSKALKAEFIKAFPDLQLMETVPDAITKKVAAHFHYDNAQRDYTPGDLEYLKYFAQGLNDRQTQTLAKSNQASVFMVYGLKKDVWTINKRMVQWLGQVTKGKAWIIYDGLTREYFTTSEWGPKKTDKWTGEIPYLPNHITIHSYREEAFCRCITLGMQKFGLPDIVINNTACYSIDDHQKLINVVAQLLVTNHNIYKGQLLVDLHKIANKTLRTEMLSNLYDNAKKKVVLQVKDGKYEDGDPFNRILEINFENKNYESPQVYQEQTFSDLFGSKNPVYVVSNNEEILQASNAAKAQLPALQTSFNKGLDNGTILLKAPFEDDEGGIEWMWVEVTNWKTSKVKGILQSEPFGIKNLQAGATVTINQDDVFDYIHQLPDGTIEGNKTSELILKYQD